MFLRIFMQLNSILFYSTNVLFEVLDILKLKIKRISGNSKFKKLIITIFYIVNNGSYSLKL